MLAYGLGDRLTAAGALQHQVFHAILCLIDNTLQEMPQLKARPDSQHISREI
jgi:hypothetical protein